MNSNIACIKGIHPGKVLERELNKRKLAKGRFAISINEFPQTLVSITKGTRRMNTSLSLRLEKALGFEEGYFMILQTYYDIEQEKKKQRPVYKPDLSKIRPVVFWDTEVNSIDWKKNKPAVINRIFERGNEQEINEIINFYGKSEVLSVLTSEKSLSPSVKEKVEIFLK